MNISPEVFGPYFWGALHTACLGSRDPEALRNFVNSYPLVLPCGACRFHFEKVLAENPLPESDNPIVLFEWSVLVHNIVNAKIGKPTITPEAAFDALFGSKINFNMIVFFAVLLLGLIFFILKL